MNYDATALAEPQQAEAHTAAFDAVDILGLCRLYRRRPTLDGSIPMRGSYCRPFLDGNAAGVHLQFVDPALLVTTSGGPVLQLTDEALDRVSVGYEGRVRELAGRGLIERGGYWFDQLMEGFATRRGSRLRLWTGWLVRPRVDGILVSRAYNRWCLVDLQEHVITGERYVPLMLELDSESVHSPETWLDTDLAVLTPIESGMRVAVSDLADNPSVGQCVHDYFTVEELGKVTGRYRKISQTGIALPGLDVCRLTTVGSANTVRLRRFEQYRTATGISTAPPAGTFFEYAVVENSVAVSMRWDGNNLRDIAFDPPDVSGQCGAAWESVYGEEPGERMAWWTEYVLPLLGPHRAEPVLSMPIHVFAETPEGWSCVIDGYSHPGLPGMRGVIATDVFHLTPAAFEIRALGQLELKSGIPLARFLPVPRRLLDSEFRGIPMCRLSEA